MTRARAVGGAMAFGLLASASPALSAEQIYTYSVVHPIYGEIGTFADAVDRSPEGLRIDAHLRVAVKLLGVVAYREEADTTEVLRGGRLVSLESVTNKDGRHLEVHGAAHGDQFMVNATSGSYAAPAKIVPSDPWVLKRTGDELVVSTSSGKMVSVQITGGDYETVSMNGTVVSARHYVVNGDKRQEVWLDNHQVPIMFRSMEDGTAIDFVLQNTSAAGDTTTVAALRHSSGARSENDDK